MYIDLNPLKNKKEILDYAMSMSFNSWVDEKGSDKFPDVWVRHKSELTYEEAYELMKDERCLWAGHYRDMSWSNAESYWDFGGTTTSNIPYGELFIWIQLSYENGKKVIEKFNLKIKG